MLRLQSILLASLMLLQLATPAHANTTQFALTPEQAKQDARILKTALTELHPALTKYLTQAQLDTAFSKFETRAQAARNSADMYLAATEMAAAIRCGHTWTNVLNQEGESKKTLLETNDKLPFMMMLIANRWLVLASADPLVSAGDEIISINGMSASNIVNTMMPYLRADGSSDGKRLQQLNHNRGDYSQMDIVWPLLSPPINGYFDLDIRKLSGKQSTVKVESTTLVKRQQRLDQEGIKPMSEQWTFRIDGNTAVMTLPTFSFWNSDFDWSGFIDHAFAELNTKNIPNLIIDIRLNEGGDGAIGGKILTHLVKKPFEFTSDQSTTAYERAPYKLAKYLDTWDFSFFDRTGQVEKITSGTASGMYRFLPNYKKQQMIEPVTTPYAGKTYLLISAENSSATFQFAFLSKQSAAATLVGQSTGGNQRGLNGGQLAWVVLQIGRAHV